MQRIAASFVAAAVAFCCCSHVADVAVAGRLPAFFYAPDSAPLSLSTHLSPCDVPVNAALLRV